MAHDLRKAFRQVSNVLLREFFEHEECSLDIPWESLKETTVEPIFEAWTGLSDHHRKGTEIALQDVQSMAEIDGLRVLVDEASKLGIADQLNALLIAHPGRADKAMLTYLRFPQVWDTAVRFAHADALSHQRYWVTRKGCSTRPPRADPTAMAELQDALKLHFVKKEGRGHRCIVEPFHRSAHLWYFFAYIDDFADMSMELTDDNTLRRVPQRRMFETVFVHDSADGTLSLHCRGGKPVYAPLQKLFSRIALGEVIGEAGPQDHPYSLNRLLDREYEYPTDPTDGIVRVQIRRLRLVVKGEPRRRITVEADPDGLRDDIFRLMDRWLKNDLISPAMVNVTGATLSLGFEPGRDGWPASLTFDISHPNSDNLRSCKREEVRAIAARYLKEWKIDVG